MRDRVTSEHLTSGITVHGVRPLPVTVLATILHGTDTVELVFRDHAGATDTQLLYSADLARLTVERPGSRWAFALRDTACAAAMAVSLYTAPALDDEDPRLWCWVGNVFVTDIGIANAARRETLDSLFAVISVVHVDGTIKDNEDLWPIVYVPDVGLIGPVQPDRCIVDLRNVQCAPRTLGGITAGIEEAHALNPATRGASQTVRRVDVQVVSDKDPWVLAVIATPN